MIMFVELELVLGYFSRNMYFYHQLNANTRWTDYCSVRNIAVIIVMIAFY